MSGIHRDIRLDPLERHKNSPDALLNLAIQKAANRFEAHQTVKDILKKCGIEHRMDQVYEQMDLEMPLSLACQKVSNEDYWKRRTLFVRGNNQVHKHGNSWKTLFCEIHVAQLLETLELDPPADKLAELQIDLRACGPFVHQLELRQLPSHFEVSTLFANMPALTKVTLTFGQRRLGMEYDRAAFGMKLSDAMATARLLRTHRLLTTLSLPCNLIDDELIKVLMQGLKAATMLTHLDLSHNKIGDAGARRLSRLLDGEGNHCLFSLDLSDNQIHAHGALQLGAKLGANFTLCKLNLRLNRLGDEGAEHFLSDLRANRTLRELHLGANNISHKSLPILCDVLANPDCPLVSLDVSANPLYPRVSAAEQLALQIKKLSPGGQDALAKARIGASEEANAPPPLAVSAEEEEALQHCSRLARCLHDENRSLTTLEIRSCNLPSDIQAVCNTAVMTKYLAEKKIPLEAWRAAVENQAKLEETRRLQSAELESKVAAVGDVNDGEDDDSEGEEDSK